MSLYQLLAGSYAHSIPWGQVFLFWGDERHVPPDHPDSNYRMVSEAMLSKVPVPMENVFRIHAEKDPSRAAADYEQTLKNFFQLRPGEVPRFDLILLGLGSDGHTASLFPDTAVLQEQSRLVVAHWIDKLQTYRITLTFPVLNNSTCVMFLVTGGDKADVLREVLETDASANHFPSKLIQPKNGRLLWLIDRAAASALSSNAEGNSAAL